MVHQNGARVDLEIQEGETLKKIAKRVLLNLIFFGLALLGPIAVMLTGKSEFLVMTLSAVLFVLITRHRQGYSIQYGIVNTVIFSFVFSLPLLLTLFGGLSDWVGRALDMLQ